MPRKNAANASNSTLLNAVRRAEEEDAVDRDKAVASTSAGSKKEVSTGVACHRQGSFTVCSKEQRHN